MLRALYKSDIAQMLLIENAVHIVPWTEETFRVCFQTGYAVWGVEIDKKLIGFIVVSLHTEECHILNVCVAHAYQHQGWGRKLLTYVTELAKQNGAGIVYLEVRRSNTKAISLYRKEAFHLIGERKGYYPTVAGQEDALIFAKSLVREDG